jgi:hypothetical protein
MKVRNQSMTRLTILAVSLFLTAPLVSAQGGQRGGGQRGEGQRGGRGEGAPAAASNIPIPRMPDGTPNLSWDDPAKKGYWRSGMHWEYGKDQLDAKAREEGLPYQPWAKALHEYRDKTQSKDDPEVFCLPGGGPRATSTMGPWEFIQLPQQKRIIRIFQEIAHMYQIIYMDGRPHPPEATEFPTWLGHSVGHWEGDTLVVDTVGFNEGHWLDRSGDVRTSKTHLVERFTRASYTNLRYEATVDDPGAYTKPFTIGWDIRWVPSAEIQEYVCQENNRYLEHYANIQIEGVDPELQSGKAPPKK